jgi:hypothetical protein
MPASAVAKAMADKQGRYDKVKADMENFVLVLTTLSK